MERAEVELASRNEAGEEGGEGDGERPSVFFCCMFVLPLGRQAQMMIDKTERESPKSYRSGTIRVIIRK